MNIGWLPYLQISGLAVGSLPSSLLALLISGHVLADFLFQSRQMADSKMDPAVLLKHATVVSAVHLALVMPFLSGPVVLVVVAVGILHGLIDVVKARLAGGRQRALLPFFLDQGAHLAVVLGAWFLLRTIVDLTAVVHVSTELLETLVLTSIVVAALAFNATGGSAIVEGVLSRFDLSPLAEAKDDVSGGLVGSGRMIGILERTLTLVLVLVGQWAATVLLVAVKSIARFEDLKQRPFAEYYLMGTLTSLIVAVAVGLLLELLIR